MFTQLKLDLHAAAGHFLIADADNGYTLAIIQVNAKALGYVVAKHVLFGPGVDKSKQIERVVLSMNANT